MSIIPSLQLPQPNLSHHSVLSKHHSITIYGDFIFPAGTRQALIVTHRIHPIQPGEINVVMVSSHYEHYKNTGNYFTLNDKPTKYYRSCERKPQSSY